MTKKIVAQNCVSNSFGLSSTVTGCVCEKIAQNAGQPIIVKIISQILPWKKGAQTFWSISSIFKKLP
jgi:hypothetical protein